MHVITRKTYIRKDGRKDGGNERTGKARRGKKCGENESRDSRFTNFPRGGKAHHRIGFLQSAQGKKYRTALSDGVNKGKGKLTKETKSDEKGQQYGRLPLCFDHDFKD